jgi:integrative and conjugative element protein (TIGR02256 family)
VEENEIIFEMSNGGRIKLSTDIFEVIDGFKQREKKASESGGVLLGRFIKGSKDIVIDKVSVPMKGDVQTRYSFKRFSLLHQRMIDEEWSKSKQTCNYLGEWHTHPEYHPDPSGVDRKDWKRKLQKDSFSSRYLYFVIVGIESICMWEGDRRTLEIRKLNKIGYGKRKDT